MNLFADRLRKLRNEHDWSQEELGKRINVTKVSISGYENGNRSPDTETLQKIADVLDVSVDYLLGRSHHRGSSMNNGTRVKEIEEILSDPNAVLLFNNYKNATEEEKIMFLEILNSIIKAKKLK